MGWASGSDIAEVVAKLLLKYVPKDKLKMEAQKALNALEDQDWDCQNEVELFDYILVLEEIKEKENYEDYEIADMEKKIKKYNKKFGF